MALPYRLLALVLVVLAMLAPGQTAAAAVKSALPSRWTSTLKEGDNKKKPVVKKPSMIRKLTNITGFVDALPSRWTGK